MKKLFLILCLMFSFTTLGQPESNYIEPSLVKYVDEFVKEGKKRGFDAVPYLKLVDSIYIKDNMDLLVMGKYKPKFKDDKFYGSVRINTYSVVDRLMLRWVIFHELGHACGYIKHSCVSCDNIMSQFPYADFTFGIYMDESVWHKYLNIFFTNLKSIPESENYHLKYINSIK